MTREEEIHKAAEEFAFSGKTESPDFHDAINDFYYGAKWADETMIEKACEWIKKNRDELSRVNTSGFVEIFKKAMEL